MKLIIEIDKDYYEMLRYNVEHGEKYKPFEIIANGIPYEERPQGEWIPVSERLPDKSMPCLVAVGKFNLTQIAVYSDLMATIDHKIFYQGDYGKNNFQNITEYVNAWMPLPKSYRGGEEE